MFLGKDSQGKRCAVKKLAIDPNDRDRIYEREVPSLALDWPYLRSDSSSKEIKSS